MPQEALGVELWAFKRAIGISISEPAVVKSIRMAATGNFDIAAPDLSVVIPVHNEEAVVGQTLVEVRRILDGMGLIWEIIVVDDGSVDGTAEAFKRAAGSGCRYLRLSRQFGKEAALCAGLEACRGRAAVVMDGDLQHPPTRIPDMVAAWKSGFKIVHGQKRSRGRESFFYRLAAHGFYSLFRWLGAGDLRNASDFKLLDREAIDALNALPERGRFFRGLVPWLGFSQTTLEFDVAERAGGGKSWSLRHLLLYGITNCIRFSQTPLYVIAITGFLFSLLGGGLFIQTLFNSFTGRAAVGFTTVIALIILFGGLLQSSIGLIALYLAQVLLEQKRRPLYILDPRE